MGEEFKHEHTHEHEHHHEHTEIERKEQDHTFDHVEKQVYMLENLDCANCAAKIERKIQELPQVDFANLIFPTKQLQIVSNSEEELLPILQQVCDSMEEGVIVKKREYKKEKTGVAHGVPKWKQEVLYIIAGVIVWLVAIFLQNSSKEISLFVYVAGYLMLGWNVLKTAGKNILKGQVFDENFLMSIATLGAFFIGEYTEALGVMVFYRIGELFESIAVARSRSQIMEAVDLRPEVVNRVVGDQTEEIPANEAKVGDFLLVRPGDRIPLDGVVVSGNTRIDTSAVTGEPVPVMVKEQDPVISGCVNLSGVVTMKVEQELKDSMVSRILDAVENAAAGKPKIDRFITRFSKVYTPFVVILALVVAIIPSLVTGDWNYWVYTALTFLVISCPCALVLSVPLAFFAGIGAGSKEGILFKGGSTIESLQEVKAIVMDKTGTVTKGCFSVQEVISAGDTTKEELLSMAAGCEQHSTHPIAGSIMEAAKEQNLAIMNMTEIEEISGKGICAKLEGHKILCGNKKLLELYGIEIPLQQSDIAGTEVFLAKDAKYVGRIVISDEIKPEAQSVFAQLKKLGIYTAMLTGDEEKNAKEVANHTGIDEVYAKLLPEDKVSKLAQIRKERGRVMFVGDGINDAPVLAGADVGAAMGSGADAAIEAADVVFMTSSLDAVPQSLKIAKTTRNIAKQNVIFALTIKVLVMLLGLFHMANMWMAVFADTGVAMICIMNSVRILYFRRNKKESRKK